MATNYNEYINLLKSELVPAFGCTEPIAIAFAAAKARSLLCGYPKKIQVICSGNVIKNAMGVTIPSSGGLKGVAASAALGAIGGNSDKKLEVLTAVSQSSIEETKKFLSENKCSVELLETPHQLHIIVKIWDDCNSAFVEIVDQHTNIVRIEKNDEIIFALEHESGNTAENIPTFLTLAGILDFAENADIEILEDLFSQQIEYNSAIGEEGLEKPYGARVGKTLLKAYGDSDIKIYLRALTSAGSDARMGGCTMPVVINSGSGNQGMTVSLPVIGYTQKLGMSRESTLRGLAVSNLVALWQKKEIGRLSAFCGVVSAACGSGAAINYLQGGNAETIGNTISNTLASISGMICDGAKASCAGKISVALEAAFLGHEMAMSGNIFAPGEGIIKSDIEKTVKSIGTLASKGMAQTDRVILDIMLER